ncbi:MAG TPA: phage tail protein [Thermoanaerobaculia bacterium]|nr:phage tail protein [Thermoanaerobaculia bacterium]
MATGDRRDPFRSFNFAVEFDGITRMGFRECSGLDASQDPIEYREGTEGLTSRKLPGLNKYSNITLKWGMTDDAEMWDWRKKAMTGKIERKNGSIVLLDDTGTEKMRWNFREAWPTKWTGPSFNATGNEVAIETLEIAHEGLELQE